MDFVFDMCDHITSLTNNSYRLRVLDVDRT